MMCFIGQQNVFVDAEETIKRLKGVELNAKQIERVCHYYGELLEQEDNKKIKDNIFQRYDSSKSNQIHYAMIDGAMYLTKEDKWKEAKLGRIFNIDDTIKISSKRNIITNSTYVSHLGNVKEFFPKIEYYIEELKSLVIIADGARWIWNWADDVYPDATQILDFFHAKEHLCEFAINYFKEESYRSEWIDKQCKIMLEDNTQKVIDTLKELPKSNKKIDKQKNNLISYYQKNKNRMRYSVFKRRNLLIGSGAIESAHRNVLQQRMKLSGQHWTKKGFQQIANLRTVFKSDNANKINELVRIAA